MNRLYVCGRSFNSYILNLNPACYINYARMSKGVSPNLVTWNGASPSTGWSGTRATLSDVTTPTPPVSVKAMKVLCNDGGGAGTSTSIQAIATYAKYVGLTHTLSAYVNAASGNALQSDFGILDSVAGTYSSNLTKDDAWRKLTVTRRCVSSVTSISDSFRGKNASTANITDQLFVDSPLHTVPQFLSLDHNRIVLHPDMSAYPLYNGTTDLTTFETDPIGTNACVVMFTAKITAAGSNPRILDNGKFLLYANPNKINLSSDGATTTAISGVSSFNQNQTYRVVIFRTAAGVVNIFINGVLSGSADQASGTPASGTTLLCQGNNVSGTKSYTGTQPDLTVLTGVPYALANANKLAFAQNDYNMWKKGN